MKKVIILFFISILLLTGCGVVYKEHRVYPVMEYIAGGEGILVTIETSDQIIEVFVDEDNIYFTEEESVLVAEFYEGDRSMDHALNMYLYLEKDEYIDYLENRDE